MYDHVLTLKDLKAGDHPCHFYNTGEERRCVLSRFLLCGLQQNQKALCISQDQSLVPLQEYTEKDECTLQESVECGSLQMLSPEKMYVKGDIFDPEAALSFLQKEAENALAEGYTALRVASDMTPVLSRMPDSDQLLEYEIELNQKFSSSHQTIGLCQYDRSQCDADVLLRVLQAHQNIILGTEVYENFYYIPPRNSQASASSDEKLKHWMQKLETRKERNFEHQKRLQQSEHRYRNFFRTCRDALFITSPDGRWLDVNEATVDLFGCDSREELERMGVPAMYANSSERDEHLRLICERGFVQDNPIQMRKKDGSVIDTLITSVPVQNEDGEIVEFQGTIRDVTESNRIKQELQQKCDEQALLLENMEAQVWYLTDVDTYGTANTAHANFFGLRREDIEHKKLDTFLPKEVAEVCKEGNRKVFESGTSLTTEEWLSSVDGEARLFSIDKTPKLEGNGNVTYVVCVATDITEHKRTEEALRRSEQFLQNIFDSIQDGLSILDTDFNIVQVNNWMEKRHSAEMPLVGKKCYAAYHDRSEVCTGCPSIRALYNGEPHTEEIQLFREQGPRWAELTAYPLRDHNNQITGIIEHVRDITERKRAEQSLLDSESELNAIVKKVPYTMVLVDSNLNIRQVNRQGAEFTGSSPEKLYGLDPGEALSCIHALNDPAGCGHTEHCGQCMLRCTLLDTLHRQREHNDVETKMSLNRDAGDEERIFLLQSAPLRLADEPMALAVFDDITEWRKTQQELQTTNQRLQDTLEELRNTQSQLIDQERQRALTTMVSGIAHEFNNALSPIQGFTTLLLEQPETLQDRDKAVHYLEQVQKAATNAAKTIRRMRKFYRPREQDAFNSLDLNETITDAISITKPRWKEEAAAAGKTIDIQTDLGDIPPVWGHEAEMNEALTNLIFNAVDAIPENGIIHISTYVQDQRVVIDFSDNGEGMAEETEDRCLDPFYTTKTAGGSGLGLAVLQGIVQRHQGNLIVDSKEGQGTTFRIMLPRIEDADLSVSRKSSSE